MFRLGKIAKAKSFRLNLKYPSLISYHKLPWETIQHDTTQLHMHAAPHFEQLLTVAATTHIPHLTVEHHPTVSPAEQLRLLPGVVYLKGRGPTGATELPEGFTSYTISDPSCLQYYGRLHRRIAGLQTVQLLTSGDLRLLCLSLHFDKVLTDALAEGSSLAKVSAPGGFSLFHFFRPNRPANELTRPFEKYFVHRPTLHLFNSFDSHPLQQKRRDNHPHRPPPDDAAAAATSWAPVLQIPRRASGKAAVTPLPPYRPPQSYLMGLAERLAVRPGDSFGRRSLMWGTWF